VVGIKKINSGGDLHKTQGTTHKVIIVITILLFVYCANRTKVRRENVLNTDEYKKYGIVSFSRIGIAGHYTENYIRIWNIAKDNDAENRFSIMLEEPALDIKLYALMGLKIINSDKYIVYRERLSKIKTGVRYGGGGCVIEVRPVNKIVEFIDQYQLREPDTE